MRELLLHHPTFHLALQFTLGGGALLFVVLASFVMPFRVNRRLDPILGPQKPGERWETGKSPAFYAYFYIRASDYARAAISDKFSIKKFGISKSTVRSSLRKSDVWLCWFFKVVEYSLAILIGALCLVPFILKFIGMTDRV
jgi:hypothetical protein